MRTSNSYLYVKLQHPIHEGVVAFPIQNCTIQSPPKLKLTSPTNYSLVDVPSDVLIYLFEFLDWKSIIKIEQINQYLRTILRETESSSILWYKVIILRLKQDPWFPFPLDMKKNPQPNPSSPIWRQLFIETQHRHRVMEKIWSTMERFASIEVKQHLRAPMLNEQCFQFEKLLEKHFKHTLQLPFDLRSSLCIHDGEDDSTWGLHALGSANSNGLLGLSRFLQSKEILVEYETIKHVLENGIIRDEQNDYLDNDQVVMIPLTATINYTQLCLDLLSGKIFIRNGMQLLFKSHSLLELFHSLLDIKRKNYPPIPNLLYH